MLITFKIKIRFKTLGFVNTIVQRFNITNTNMHNQDKILGQLQPTSILTTFTTKIILILYYFEYKMSSNLWCIKFLNVGFMENIRKVHIPRI
jgi:hypothetical protein